MQTSWRFNATNALYDPGVDLTKRTDVGQETQKDDNVLGKRSADDKSTTTEHSIGRALMDNNKGALVHVGNTNELVEQFEGSEPSLGSEVGTPQKNLNKKKKIKTNDGGAIDSSTTSGSAASLSEDRWEK